MKDCKQEFFPKAPNQQVVLEYKGVIAPTIISEIGSNLISTLNEKKSDISPMANKKLFSSFVEMMQNAFYYSPGNVEEKKVTLEVSLADGKLSIVCGNAIDPAHIERIKEKLIPLTQMTVEEIKAAYKAQLRNELHDEDDISCGAGLGLMTIARDSSEKIQFVITEDCGEICEKKVCLFIKSVI